MGAGRQDYLHDETGFARSIPIVLARVEETPERLFDNDQRKCSGWSVSPAAIQAEAAKAR